MLASVLRIKMFSEDSSCLYFIIYLEIPIFMLNTTLEQIYILSFYIHVTRRSLRTVIKSNIVAMPFKHLYMLCNLWSNFSSCCVPLKAALRTQLIQNQWAIHMWISSRGFIQRQGSGLLMNKGQAWVREWFPYCLGPCLLSSHHKSF